MAETCRACYGDGNVKCQKCDGKGRLYHFTSYSQCDNCNGSGIVKCGACDGKGKIY